MTAPDRIHAWPHSEDGWGYGTCSDKLSGPAAGAEYLRRDPAVLAADPLVQALIGAAVSQCARLAKDYAEYPNCIADRGEFWALQIADAITEMQIDATAAFQRALREAENRGLERAAELLDAEHRRYMISKGRNPDDYMSEQSVLATSVRALKEQPE